MNINNPEDGDPSCATSETGVISENTRAERKIPEIEETIWALTCRLDHYKWCFAAAIGGRSLEQYITEHYLPLCEIWFLKRMYFDILNNPKDRLDILMRELEALIHLFEFLDPLLKKAGIFDQLTQSKPAIGLPGRNEPVTLYSTELASGGYLLYLDDV